MHVPMEMLTASAMDIGLDFSGLLNGQAQGGRFAKRRCGIPLFSTIKIAESIRALLFLNCVEKRALGIVFPYA